MLVIDSVVMDETEYDVLAIIHLDMVFYLFWKKKILTLGESIIINCCYYG